MRIVVVNTAASNGGALSVLRDFYEYIRDNDTKNEWIFILSDDYIQQTDNIKVLIKREPKTNWINRLKWELVSGARFINNLKPDIVFSMQNTINRGINAPSIVYLHQPLPFQDEKKFSFIKKKERTLAIYQYIIGVVIKQSLKNANRIIVQTNWMKQSVLKKVGVNENKILIIPPKVSRFVEQVEECYPSENNFFYPASAVVYKNHQCIIEAVKILTDRGITNFNVAFTLEDIEKENFEISKDIEKYVEFTGRLSRDKVYEKYKKSILVFPSYIETFGLPLLEAQMVGSLILASDCKYSKEILEKYPNKYYFNAFNSNELADLMEKIILKEIKYKTIKDTIDFSVDKSWNDLLEELEYI